MSPLMSWSMVLAMAARVIALMPVSLTETARYHGDRSRTSQGEPKQLRKQNHHHPDLGNDRNDPLAARCP